METFVYQYTVGGLVFAIGMIYAVRQGYVGFSGRPLRNLIISMLGLGFFAGLQGYLQYADMGEGERVVGPRDRLVHGRLSGHLPPQLDGPIARSAGQDQQLAG